MDFPELAARTHRFRYGMVRAVSVAADGSRVLYLRSQGPEDPVDRLWSYEVGSGETRLVADPAALGEGGELPAHERALRERMRLAAEGIGSYAADPAARVAAFTLAGRLYRAEPATGAVTAIGTAGPVVDPRPDPTGTRIGYVTDGALRVVDADGRDTLLASEPGASITWGLADHVAAEEFGRHRGWWWSPDGRTVLAARVDNTRVARWYLHDPSKPEEPPHEVAYPRAGTANAEVSLHLLDLDGGWVDVRWDRELYPYVVAAQWADGGPLITVLRRSQQHGLVLAIDARTGETQVHAELTDTRWVEPIDGTPLHLPDGRVLVGGELLHDGYDARCLFADGTLLTPPSLYVRRVVGAADGDLLVEGSDGEPSEQHLFRVRTAVATTGVDAQRLTHEPGWHVAAVAGDVLAIGRACLDHTGTVWSVRRGGVELATLPNVGATPPYAPRPLLDRVTDRALPAAVLYPTGHVAGRRLPVLLDIYGGPGGQEVLAIRNYWLARQWFADAGFAVVSIDNRGTPGVAPSFEKAIYRRMADVVLADQVDGLRALADKHPDLDLERVGIRGWSFGGWLAALAVLRRPDVFRCGVAGAPVTDWTLYDTGYTERYLGAPDDGTDVYAHHSLLDLAAEPPIRPDEARPLLLAHGLVDDNVVAAHTLRLSAELLRTGRPHAVLPLPGASHMAAGGIGPRLLRLEREFLVRHLAP
ncbi:peptidase [Pilimelia anulata]|uniref:Peptidase n=1 Tax=Pilimelia anulata TaxID=53371 RepID=A0A8J3BCE4_9ACTN|nr:prolyl oligopeptidase family serine peptidase [Pilimelia anulata]GGK00582.1 peptidase [Pilimelia anulata]